MKLVLGSVRNIVFALSLNKTDCDFQLFVFAVISHKGYPLCKIFLTEHLDYAPSETIHKQTRYGMSIKLTISNRTHFNKKIERILLYTKALLIFGVIKC
jgi:hypothetical protein